MIGWYCLGWFYRRYCIVANFRKFTTPRAPQISEDWDQMDNVSVDIAIIGAGFAGLGAAIRLLKEGRTNIVVFERAAEVGGTWRDNTYPGCACDVASPLYSFSFAPNPRWSHVYSPQPEILEYIKQTVDTFNVRPYIRFNTDIVRAEFNEQTGHWTLIDQTGQTTVARVVIMATGPLNRPSIPKLAGSEQFSGKAFHTAQWDHSTVLAGKRVAVIGTGASAIQIVPELAKIVQQLTVYQRTAPYVRPRPDRPFSDIEKRLFSALPVTQQLHRSLIYWVNELGGLAFLGNKTLANFGTKQLLKHITDTIQDPDLQRKVTPDYELGCKRVLVSSDYYPALNRPNVELVTDRIETITPTGIRTADGIDRPADVIVYGTGFVAADVVSNLNIVGCGGRDLQQTWARTGAQAHKGISVSGFPNLLFLVGPNTGLGHNSIIHMIESQLNYVLGYVRFLYAKGADVFLDVKPGVQAAYNIGLQEDLKTTVWASGCQSWYLNKSGRNTTIWPKLAVDYRRETARINPLDYAVTKADTLS